MQKIAVGLIDTRRCSNDRRVVGELFSLLISIAYLAARFRLTRKAASAALISRFVWGFETQSNDRKRYISQAKRSGLIRIPLMGTMTSSLAKTGMANRDFQSALSALQAGKLGDAERLSAAILRADPKHVGALNLMGVVLMQLQRFAEAETYFHRALQERPKSDTTLYNYALVLKALNRPAEALQRFDEALKINPSVAETWNNRGTVCNVLKRYEQAIGDFDKAIALNSRYAEALCNKGKSLATLERADEALATFDRALAIKPDLAEAWFGRGNIVFERKRYDDAFAAYDRALQLKPDLVEVWLRRGNGFFRLKRYEEATAAYDKALALKSDLGEAWLGRGNVLNAFKQHEEALSAFDRALALNPNLAEAWLGRGEVFVQLQQYDDASAAYDQVFALTPDLAEAWLGRGNIFFQLERHDEAFAAYDRAIALKPDLAEAWLGRGNIFFQLGRHDEAFAAYDRAIALKPDLAEAWFASGYALGVLGNDEEALFAFNRALALNRDFAEAWAYSATSLAQLRQYDKALAAYDAALTRRPDLGYAKGDRLHVKLHMSDWINLGAEFSELVSAIRAKERAVSPFHCLAMPPATAADQLQCAKTIMAHQRRFPPIWRGEIYSHDRIRIDYFSADFRNHPGAQLVVGLFEHHDKSRFEITALSYGPDDGSDLRNRIKSAAENFVDVRTMTDDEIAQFIRRREVDIVVDRNGLTQYNRFRVLSRRVAPVQVNFLGYPGTMGANWMDYIIADPAIIPEDHFQFYSEQVVWLPDTYQPNDNKRRISERLPARAECNLPEGAFVFCCFNNTYKITPEVFDVWMRLLAATEDSVLWLIETGSTATQNLRREAKARGISPERLIFAPKIPRAEHLSRHRQADLFLDTLPYNAHTTASDALWVGLPVLTCLGVTFAGRVAASLLRAVGLPELVTTSLEDYEALALKLAREPSFLAAIKAKLARNRDTYPLFDTARYTRHIEAAYTTMWERYQRGEAPEAFAVEPQSEPGGAGLGQTQPIGPQQSGDR